MTPGRLQFARQIRPVRLDPPPHARASAGAAKKLTLQRVVGDILRQRPYQPRRRRAFQTVLDRAARHAQTPAYLARAHPVVVKP